MWFCMGVWLRCIYEYVYDCVDLCMSMEARGGTRVLFYHSPLYSFKTGSHSEPGARLAFSKA